jgi:hypothetical protein
MRNAFHKWNWCQAVIAAKEAHFCHQSSPSVVCPVGSRGEALVCESPGCHALCQLASSVGGFTISPRVFIHSIFEVFMLLI